MRTALMENYVLKVNAPVILVNGLAVMTLSVVKFVKLKLNV